MSKQPEVFPAISLLAASTVLSAIAQLWLKAGMLGLGVAKSAAGAATGFSTAV